MITVQLQGKPDYKTETCEINTLYQAQPRAAVEKHWRPQSSHSGTSVIQGETGTKSQDPRPWCFHCDRGTRRHKATQLKNLDSRQRCGTHTSARFDTVCTFSSAKVSSAIASWNRSPLKPMFRRNTVAAMARVIHDDLTVRSFDDNTTVPEDPQLTLNPERARALRDCCKHIFPTRERDAPLPRPAGENATTKLRSSIVQKLGL